jgi:hypothetical protein
MRAEVEQYVLKNLFGKTAQRDSRGRLWRIGHGWSADRSRSVGRQVLLYEVELLCSFTSNGQDAQYVACWLGLL